MPKIIYMRFTGHLSHHNPSIRHKAESNVTTGYAISMVICITDDNYRKYNSFRLHPYGNDVELIGGAIAMSKGMEGWTADFQRGYGASLVVERLAAMDVIEIWKVVRAYEYLDRA